MEESFVCYTHFGAPCGLPEFEFDVRFRWLPPHEDRSTGALEVTNTNNRVQRVLDDEQLRNREALECESKMKTEPRVEDAENSAVTLSKRHRRRAGDLLVVNF